MLAGFPKQIDAVLGNEMITYVPFMSMMIQLQYIHTLESRVLISHRTQTY